MTHSSRYLYLIALSKGSKAPAQLLVKAHLTTFAYWLVHIGERAPAPAIHLNLIIGSCVISGFWIGDGRDGFGRTGQCGMV